MRILHLTDDLTLIGGVQSYLSMLRTILPRTGIECEVWAPSPGAMRGAVSRWYGRRYRRQLGDLIMDLKPDVIHAHNVWMRLSPFPLQAAKQAGVPVMMTVHDYNWICPRKWMITEDDLPCETGFGSRCAVSNCRGSHEGRRWIAYNALRWVKTSWHRGMLTRWVDRFVSPSQHLAGWMERSLGVTDVLHIPNFAGAPRSGVARSVERPAVLAFAGRLSREKGVDILLRSMPAIVSRHPEVRLIIAGDGPERCGLERLSNELAIDSVVRFVGPLGPDALEQLYTGAGLVVLPTLWMENCPVSVLEAFANGRAVVASRIGGLPELIDDGRTGVLFERGNHRELSAGLIALLSDPNRIETMGRNAEISWARSYTPKLHGERLRDAYDELISGAA